ncbi:MAG: hypothetical protein AAFZ02_13325, partial [Pseudomonadota bacterium]
MTPPKPVVLCILDGWGDSPETAANAPALAATPNFDRLRATCPSAQLITHGPDAGLPSGQMGNSEVGHTNIGAGRIVWMDLPRIDRAVEDGSFAANPVLRDLAARAKAAGGAVHLAGLASPGGVHSHQRHIAEAARALGAEVVELDLAIPFTAARARNAGFRALLARAPELDFVQFVDGDCELR